MDTMWEAFAIAKTFVIFGEKEKQLSRAKKRALDQESGDTVLVLAVRTHLLSVLWWAGLFMALGLTRKGVGRFDHL